MTTKTKTKKTTHLSSDGNRMDGAPRRACGCQSCRHRFGPPGEPPETFPQYLRRVGADHLASGHEYTAEDYDNAADRIAELEAMLKTVCERYVGAVIGATRNGDLDDAYELITINPLETP